LSYSENAINVSHNIVDDSFIRYTKQNEKNEKNEKNKSNKKNVETSTISKKNTFISSFVTNKYKIKNGKKRRKRGKRIQTTIEEKKYLDEFVFFLIAITI